MESMTATEIATVRRKAFAVSACVERSVDRSPATTSPIRPPAAQAKSCDSVRP
jgi:hypothetical protein